MSITLYDPTGISGTSRYSFQNFFKDDYLPEVDAWIHTYKGSIAKHLAPNAGKMGGKKSVGLAITGMPQSAGPGRFEGHNIPTAKSASAINPEKIARSMFYVLQWTMEVEWSARKGNSVAWRSPMQVDMEMARENFLQVWIRKLTGSRFDILGQCYGTTHASGTSAVVYGKDSRTSAAASFYKVGTMFLRVGQSIDFAADYIYGRSAHNHSSASAKEYAISAIATPEGSTCTLTVDTMAAYDNGTATDGDYIIPYAERGEAALSTGAAYEAYYMGHNGLDDVCCADRITSSLYGLTKSSYDGVMGTYVPDSSSSSRQFSERYIDLLLRKCQSISGKHPDRLLLSPETLSEVARENRGDRIFQPVVTGSGYGNLTYTRGDRTVPYEADWLLKPGIVYGITNDDWEYHEQKPLGPVDRDFSYRFVASKAASQMVAAKMGAVGCKRPFSNGAADDFTYASWDVT